jgi:hypothetical protein
MLFFCLGGSISIVRKLIIKVKQKYQSLMKRWTKPSNCVGQFTPLLSWNEKDQIMFNLFQKQKEKQKKMFQKQKEKQKKNVLETKRKTSGPKQNNDARSINLHSLFALKVVF